MLLGSQRRRCAGSGQLAERGGAACLAVYAGAVSGRTIACILAAVLTKGCATASTTVDPEVLAAMGPVEALSVLESESGPARFAMVSSRIYRGGQPTADHLALLRAVGVTRVIDLRRESLGARRVERSVARALGLELVAFPFYGLFGADPLFLDELLGELTRDDGGAVYVHCDNGRDRTGLVVALYRVVAEGWDPDRAWHTEVLAPGHRPSLISREIELTFRDHVHETRARMQTLRDGPARRRAAGSSRDVQSGRMARPTPHRAPSTMRDT